MKVDFFIVGAAKSGTTSLYNYLFKHPEVCMSSIKEPNFFSNKLLNEQKMYYKDVKIDSIEKYHNLFDKHTNNKICGEASVSYLFYEKIAKQIKKYNKNAKIIIMLRNPIERAFSHYLMDLRLGFVNESFDSIIYRNSKNKNQCLHYQQYIKVGNYSSQVLKYLDSFGKDNILIINYDDFVKSPSLEFKKTCKFLQISKQFNLDFDKKYNVGKLAKNKTIAYLYSVYHLRRFVNLFFSDKLKLYFKRSLFHENTNMSISLKTRQYLYDYYLNDIKKLNLITSNKFAKWIR